MDKENKDSSHICHRIRAIREALELKQTDFAKRLDISAPGVSELEAGKYLPRTDIVVLLVEQFNVKTDYLLFGYGAMFNNELDLPPKIMHHLIVNKEQFFQMMDYMNHSQFVQYSMMSSFQRLLTREGETIKMELENFKRKKEE
ncbi:MAG: helix-turn-helix transcriptional regulator [bacterium]|nr:helix-turn-helix transcriptional regulator [bacterium]